MVEEYAFISSTNWSSYCGQNESFHETSFYFISCFIAMNEVTLKQQLTSLAAFSSVCWQTETFHLSVLLSACASIETGVVHAGI